LGAPTRRGKDGNDDYILIDEVELLLLGDILDVIRSDKSTNGDVHPWTNNPHDPNFVRKVREITGLRDAW
jgi:hypothetical protein